MLDQDCIKFLQSCLPQLGYQWEGFRRVRKQVCKRIQKRLVTLDLPDCSYYYSYLEENAEEWKILDSFCYITIFRSWISIHVDQINFLSSTYMVPFFFSNTWKLKSLKYVLSLN